jgi:hypothetical protein
MNQVLFNGDLDFIFIKSRSIRQDHKGLGGFHNIHLRVPDPLVQQKSGAELVNHILHESAHLLLESVEIAYQGASPFYIGLVVRIGFP